MCVCVCVYVCVCVWLYVVHSWPLAVSFGRKGVIGRCPALLCVSFFISRSQLSVPTNTYRSSQKFPDTAVINFVACQKSAQVLTVQACKPNSLTSVLLTENPYSLNLINGTTHLWFLATSSRGLMSSSTSRVPYIYLAAVIRKSMQLERFQWRHPTAVSTLTLPCAAQNALCCYLPPVEGYLQIHAVRKSVIYYLASICSRPKKRMLVCTIHVAKKKPAIPTTISSPRHAC